MRLMQIIKITEIELKKFSRTEKEDAHSDILITGKSNLFENIIIKINDYIYEEEKIKKLFNDIKIENKYTVLINTEEFKLRKKNSVLIGDCTVDAFVPHKPTPTELLTTKENSENNDE